MSPETRTTSLRLIHLSDPHLTSISRPDWRLLCNKRASGYWAWRRKRRRLHRPEVLQALVDDTRTQAYDHIALTGDLTQVGLPTECEQALEWLETFAPPDRVSVVPGNHDAYARASWQQTIGLWQAYMSDDDSGQTTDDVFPFVRYRGSVALIGVTTALPTPWPFATGTLGDQQLARLEACLRDTAAQGYFRVVMIHHPPVADMIGWRKRLTDTAALAGVIRRVGVELMLHGHAHRELEARLPTPSGQAVVLGAPSASMAPATGRDHAGYSIIDISRRSTQARGSHWSVKVTRRMLNPYRDEWRFASHAMNLHFTTANTKGPVAMHCDETP
jgi:3',5'-cyclic AMP phosphodiesterase CpdA